MKNFLVIGNPIKHSMSPQLHNFWIKINNIKASYDKIKLNENDIEHILQKVKNKKIDGLNVTVPFKNKVIPFLDKLSLEAESTESVNTIYLDEKNNLVGHNTDIFGFTSAIKKLNFDIEEKKIFILGAGGVVPSIIYALNRMNVSKIFISNRTLEKAEKMKIKFNNLIVTKWGKVPEFDVIINATSLGLNNESMNLDFSNQGNDKLFYDVIYNPSETNFLKEGKRLGNLSENGQLMFIYQALESFRLWHGIEPEINDETFNILKND
tara:strand:- start:2 stop:799 length:798 start_codon:yes stop_codon:yes gene_type:complete